MSEVLRDLVVSLSLDGDNFSRNLTSINKQIQEAESEFKRAASGVDNFEKSVKGTQAQLSSLQQTIVVAAESRHAIPARAGGSEQKAGKRLYPAGQTLGCAGSGQTEERGPRISGRRRHPAI